MAKGKKGKGQENYSNFKNLDTFKVEDCLLYGLMEKMTDEQKVYANSILHNTITFCNAKAGTGKTTIAVACAKLLYEMGIINKLVYIISPVEEKTMGFRPGTADEKEQDYFGALFDALVEVGEQPEKALHPEYGWVEAKSDTFLRGTNLQNCAVIIDEAQNFTRSQMKKTLSRIHDTCKVIVEGHNEQIDIPKKSASGFLPMMDIFKEFAKDRPVGFCELTVNFRGWLSSTADLLDI